MSPRVGPLEIGDKGGKHPGREPTDPPESEFDPSEKSTASTVATFRAGRHRVSMPAAVLVAALTAASGFGIAWINKPPPPVVSPLTPAQAAALEQCAGVAKDVQEIKNWTRWAEPQIGILLVRTDTRAYTPPPRAP